MKYDIKIGDYVETIDGLIGYVVDYSDNLVTMYETIVKRKHHCLIYEDNKCNFKRIGKYEFGKDTIEKIQLQEIKELCTNGTGFSYYRNRYKEIPQINIINKINEIVTRLNETEE